MGAADHFYGFLRLGLWVIHWFVPGSKVLIFRSW